MFSNYIIDLKQNIYWLDVSEWEIGSCIKLSIEYRIGRQNHESVQH